jgi:hypothetical protein
MYVKANTNRTQTVINLRSKVKGLLSSRSVGHSDGVTSGGVGLDVRDEEEALLGEFGNFGVATAFGVPGFDASADLGVPCLDLSTRGLSCEDSQVRRVMRHDRLLP